jgi:hypothetical protein
MAWVMAARQVDQVLLAGWGEYSGDNKDSANKRPITSSNDRALGMPR